MDDTVPPTLSPTAYHLVPAAAWTCAPEDEPFRPASLEAEGFVHLTHRMSDLVDVANALYRAEPGPHLVLTVALGRLSAPWRCDGDERYPHVHGPLDRDAITGVRAMARDATGGSCRSSSRTTDRHRDRADRVWTVVDCGKASPDPRHSTGRCGVGRRHEETEAMPPSRVTSWWWAILDLNQ